MRAFGIRDFHAFLFNRQWTVLNAGSRRFLSHRGQQRFVVSLPLSPSRYINRFWSHLVPTVPVECDWSLLRRFDCSQRIGCHIVLARLDWCLLTSALLGCMILIVLLRFLLRLLTLDCPDGEFSNSGFLLRVLAFSSTLVWLCWCDGSNSDGDFEFGRGFGCTKESFLSVS